MGTCRSDVKGEAQAETPRGQSTDAEHRGRSARSSDEVSVMGSEPIPMRKLSTGEPCAGKPRARFGGRGVLGKGASLPLYLI